MKKKYSTRNLSQEMNNLPKISPTSFDSNEKDKSRPTEESSGGSSTLFVGNIGSITKNQAYDLFNQYGKVVEIYMMKKPFMFVEYSSPKEAKTALNAAKRDFFHKSIPYIINYAKATVPEKRGSDRRRIDTPMSRRSRNYDGPPENDYPEAPRGSAYNDERNRDRRPMPPIPDYDYYERYDYNSAIYPPQAPFSAIPERPSNSYDQAGYVRPQIPRYTQWEYADLRYADPNQIPRLPDALPSYYNQYYQSYRY